MKKIICLLFAALMIAAVGRGPVSEKEPVSDIGEDTVKSSDTEYTKTDEIPVLEGKIIVIDPGHGLNNISAYEPQAPGSDITKPAYVSGTSGKYQTEEELNLSVGKTLYTELIDLGAKTYMTRHGHYSQRSNIERAEFANGLNADICIRIHADGSEDKNKSGISVLVPGENHYEGIDILEQSGKAGEILLENLVRYTGAENAGLSVRNDLAGFNWSKVPVVLIEMGFMSNEKEDYLLSQSDYQEKIAEGIVNGLEEYFLNN